MSERPNLKVIVSIVSLLTAAIAAGISAKAVPAGAFWVCAFAFLVVLVAFLSPWASKSFAALRRHRRAREFALRYRTELASVISSVVEVTSSSDSRSVGSILITYANQ